MLLLTIFTTFFFLHKIFAAPTTHQSGEEYTIVLDPSYPEPPTISAVLQRLSLHPSHPDVRHVYSNTAFRGFTASMRSHCIDILQNMREVAIIEKPVPVRASVTARVDAPWGLQRISTANTVTGTGNGLAYTYTYGNDSLGQGADIYVLDTGIYTNHSAFAGRAEMLFSFDSNLIDNDGHGTHVSGIAGGLAIGVASRANIIGVKALDNDGSGFSSNVIAAIDFAIQLHTTRRASNPSFVGSVISMSLESSSTSDAMASAISAASNAGIHIVVAAGNSATDACTNSPASSGGTGGPAISVGSIGLAATVSSFSNTGPCIDVYAPGENVLSAWNTGSDDLKALSGTSMATPHVTGIVAYAIAGNATLARSPELMKEWVRATALTGVVNGVVVKGDFGLLANNGQTGVAAPDTHPEGLLGFTKVSR